MDIAMNSLPTQAISSGMAVLAVVAYGALAPSLLVASIAVASVLVCVAFVAQSRRLRDEQRLVYRPVYVRRHDDRRRVRSDD